MAATDCIRMCLHCGGEFVPPKSNRQKKYCTKLCANRAINAAKALEKVPCEQCGKLITPEIGGYTRKRFCSQECGTRFRYGPKKAPVVVSAPRCEVCGHECGRLGAKTCSTVCREERNRRVGREAWRSATGADQPRQCRTCKQQFTAILGRPGPHAFCSEICARQAKREAIRKGKRIRSAAKRSKNGGQRFDPLSILERDGWRCYLCGVDTPRALRGTYHPQAPELDHVIPIAKGGLHTMENTRCACRQCNGIKSDRLIAA